MIIEVQFYDRKNDTSHIVEFNVTEQDAIISSDCASGICSLDGRFTLRFPERLKEHQTRKEY